MRAIVLGSAAGGGVPQWNCNCPNCESVREGTGVVARTQDCIAVSADGVRWFLLNASPDITRQIERHRELQPSVGRRRSSGISGIVLTNGALDHCLGLLSLREWTSFSLYATPETRAGLLERNVVFRTLRRQERHVVQHDLELGAELPLLDGDDAPSGLTVQAFPVMGKVPLHLEDSATPTAQSNVGLIVRESNGTSEQSSIAYVPAAGSLEGVAKFVQGVGCLFFDGTFWHDNELVELGLTGKTARALCHLPIGGPDGSLRSLAEMPVGQSVYIHINNTNPILRPDSPERQQIESAGVRIAEDAMRFDL